jgi:hypothetical protein
MAAASCGFPTGRKRCARPDNRRIFAYANKRRWLNLLRHLITHNFRKTGGILTDHNEVVPKNSFRVMVAFAFYGPVTLQTL